MRLPKRAVFYAGVFVLSGCNDGAPIEDTEPSSLSDDREEGFTPESNTVGGQGLVRLPEAAALIAEAKAKELSGGFSDIEECRNVASQIEERLRNPRSRPFDLPDFTFEEELEQARNFIDFCRAGSVYKRNEL